MCSSDLTLVEDHATRQREKTIAMSFCTRARRAQLLIQRAPSVIREICDHADVRLTAGRDATSDLVGFESENARAAHSSPSRRSAGSPYAIAERRSGTANDNVVWRLLLLYGATGRLHFWLYRNAWNRLYWVGGRLNIRSRPR